MFIIGGYVVFAVFVVYGGLFFFQDKLLFRPNRDYIPPQQAAYPQFKEVSLGNGQYGWLYEGKKDAPTILYFHCNSGQNSDFAVFMEPYLNKKWTVLMVEYPGYGKAQGHPGEKKMVYNGLRAYDFLEKMGKKEIVLHGFSIGTGVALAVAERKKPKMIVLEGAFYSIKSLAKRKYPFPGVTMLLKNPFYSYKRIEKIEAPLMMVHGTADQIVPYKHGVALYEKSVSKDKTFIRLEGARHAVSRYGSLDEIVPWIEKRWYK